MTARSDLQGTLQAMRDRGFTVDVPGDMARVAWDYAARETPRSDDQYACAMSGAALARWLLASGAGPLNPMLNRIGELADTLPVLTVDQHRDCAWSYVREDFVSRWPAGVTIQTYTTEVERMEWATAHIYAALVLLQP